MNSFLKSFVYAWSGIRAAATEQRNLRVHVAVALTVIAAGFFFDITATEWCIVLLTIALVIGMELMNSALENLVDLVTREQHPLAGRVKDMAAGAVLFVSMLAVIIGVIVFYGYLFPA